MRNEDFFRARRSRWRQLQPEPDGVRADVVRTTWLANLLQKDGPLQRRYPQRTVSLPLKPPRRIRLHKSGFSNHRLSCYTEEREGNTTTAIHPSFLLADRSQETSPWSRLSLCSRHISR